MATNHKYDKYIHQPPHLSFWSANARISNLIDLEGIFSYRHGSRGYFMISPTGPKGWKKESPLTAVLKALLGMSGPCGRSHRFHPQYGDAGTWSLAPGRKETLGPGAACSLLSAFLPPSSVMGRLRPVPSVWASLLPGLQSLR